MTSSRLSPDSILNWRLIAKENWQMDVPFGVTRNSGSRVRLPMRRTLLSEGMAGGGAGAGSGRLDEGAVDAGVEAQALVELRGRRRRGGERNVHVGRARQFPVGHAGEVLLADVFDRGHLAMHGDDFLFHAVDHLIDGLFFAAVVEEEGRAVVAGGGFHFRSLRFSWFMAASGPRESSRSRPCTWVSSC